MKIIIVNYRYFISSGPERYLFNITEVLQRNGHTVIPFSVKSNFNVPSEYEQDFLDPLGSGNEVYFSDYKLSNPKTLVQGLSRMIYSFEAERKFSKLIRKVKPDLIYVLHYQNKISMSIFTAAFKCKIPVINRISDFGQVCVNQHFYRTDTSSICEKCLHGSKVNAIKHKCVQNSYLYSMVKVLSLKTQEILNLSQKINAFVIPSRFTLGKLKSYGIADNKLHHIPTFFNFNTVSPDIPITYQPFALFIGRIEEEKGILTLIKAFENTDFNLKIIGFSKSGYDKVMKEYLIGKKHNIEFLGRKDFAEIQPYLASCSFTIVPSEWYDNLPNTMLESFAFRKCVVATNIGSLTELVSNGNTGFLFGLKDVNGLKQIITKLFTDIPLCITMGDKAFIKLKAEFSQEKHYDSLIHLFNETVSGYKPHLSF